MVKITYIEWDGTTRTVNGVLGQSVMETAIRNAVPGIDAECGGSCVCGTCRVYVDESWRDRAGTASRLEQAVIEVANDPAPYARLSCQMKITEALDGLIVHTPKSQR